MKTIVIKCGGTALQTPELMQLVLHNIVQLKMIGVKLIVVHGGGNVISTTCQKMKITPQFVEGIRITDGETMQIVQMVLGKINKDLVSHLNQMGTRAVGISGQDGTLLLAHALDDMFGLVGEIERVNPEILEILTYAGYIPVIAPIATSLDTTAYNVNADIVASRIAIALKADHLIFLSDVPGILDNGKKIDRIKSHEIGNLISRGTIDKGMIPKVKAAFEALKEGVAKVHLLDGREAYPFLSNEKNQIGTALEL
jgi:acetylglutamate kinase